jgi:hypothetical protein
MILLHYSSVRVVLLSTLWGEICNDLIISLRDLQ